MGKIIILKGLPASGKSTWAKEVVAESGGKVKRINKDEIRAMIDAGKWSGDREKFVLQFRDNFIQSCMGRGYDVIVDDTNLHPKHVKHIEELVEKYNKSLKSELVGGSETCPPLGIYDLTKIYEVEINDSFLQVPYKECVRRDLARPNSVGEKVIRGMYIQFVLGVEKIKQDESLPHCIICDIDGNLSLFKNKNPYDRDFENDICSEPVKDVIYNYCLSHPASKIIFLSGRSDRYRDVTEKWLYEKVIDVPHSPIVEFELHMRKEGDSRNDMILKKELFEAYVQGKYCVDYILDDRKSVKQLWVSMNLFVFDTNQTDEEF